MAVADSSTKTALFISDQPDWGDGVIVSYDYATEINTSRSGLEQRHRKRENAIVRIEWMVNGLNPAQIRSREADDRLESRFPCIVPFWTEKALSAAIMTTDNDLSIDQIIRSEFWKVGEWVYLDNGTTQQFRQIATVVDADTVTLETHASPVRFGLGTSVYPCRTCEKVGDSSQNVRTHLRSGSARRIFQTIGEQ